MLNYTLVKDPVCASDVLRRCSAEAILLELVDANGFIFCHWHHASFPLFASFATAINLIGVIDKFLSIIFDPLSRHAWKRTIHSFIVWILIAPVDSIYERFR